MVTRSNDEPRVPADDGDESARTMMSLVGGSLGVVLPLLVVLVLVAAWEAAVRILGIRTYLLPAPSVVARELMAKAGLLAMHGGATLVEVLAGYLASVLLGLPLALLMVELRWFERAVYPLLVISQTVPKMAIAPLFVVWLGFGVTPKILVVFLIAFFPIVIDGLVGLRAIQPEMLQLARSMGATSRQIFVMFRLPTALPSIFAGLKVAMTLAVVGAIVGEFIGGDQGLGYLLQMSAFNFQTPLLFATIVVLVALGLVLFLGIVLLERVLIPWEAERVARQEAAATL